MAGCAGSGIDFYAEMTRANLADYYVGFLKGLNFIDGLDVIF